MGFLSSQLVHPENGLVQYGQVQLIIDKILVLGLVNQFCLLQLFQMVGQRLGRHSQGSRQIPGGNLPLLQFEQDPSAGFVRQGRQNGRDTHYITTYFKIS